MVLPHLPPQTSMPSVPSSLWAAGGSPVLSPYPAPAPPGCVPGHGGVPDSPLGDLLCGTGSTTVPAAAWHLVGERWPLLLAAVATGLTAAAAWRGARRYVWRRHARRACWLEITPPVSATPAATVELWRLLAAVLTPPRWWTLRPARIVWEARADPHALRCGLWLPPGVNPTVVRRVLDTAWPGVRLTQNRPPGLPAGTRTTTVVLRPTQPEWLPLVDSAPTRLRGEKSLPDDDPLRAVYDGLATAGRTGGGLLQVHVSRAPARRLRVLARAMTHPRHTGPTRPAGQLLVVLADGLRRGLLAVAGVFLPGTPAGSNRRARTTDPYRAELARQARTKYSAGPHFVIAVHATASGPTRAAARSAAAAISGGFALLSPHFTRRRLRFGATAAAERWVPPARMSLATVSEVAALAGLPGEPAVHGLPAAASRRRPAGRDVFRAGPSPAIASPAGRTREAPRDGSGRAMRNIP